MTAAPILDDLARWLAVADAVIFLGPEGWCVVEESE